MKRKEPLILDPEEYQQVHQTLASDRIRPRENTFNGIHLLSDFKSHQLDEQSDIAQLDRVDAKYALPVDFLEELLQTLVNEYSVLQVAGQRSPAYETTYFDTPDRMLYQMHHNGKLNRYKVRYRRYAATNTGFFEIKKKSNKRRTIKKRISLRTNTEAKVEANTFCYSLLGDITHSLQPSLYVYFRRITLMNRQRDERITIDIDLHFARPDNDTQAHRPYLMIVELKRFGKISESRFLRLTKKYRLRPMPFSKYCIGNCLTHESGLKINNFKSILAQINNY